MAVDTQSKRMSAVARRRLPWLRRFALPIPDGTISQADRQHLLGLYAGIEAGEEATAYVRGCTAQAIGPKSVLSVAPIMPQAVGQSQTLSIGACE